MLFYNFNEDILWTIEEIIASNNGARHSHNPVPATIKKHIKNKDGSCKTTYYDGAKCSCGQMAEPPSTITPTQVVANIFPLTPTFDFVFIIA